MSMKETINKEEIAMIEKLDADGDNDFGSISTDACGISSIEIWVR